MRGVLRKLLLILTLLPAAPAATQGVPADAAPLFDALLWDVADAPFALSDLRGRPLIVNFWARWCGPCRAEIPEFVAAHRRLGSKDALVVGVALEEHGQTVREFARVYEMEYLLLLARDRGPPLLRALGNASAALPYTLVIDRSGRVLSRKLGVMSRTDLDQAIAALR